MKKLRHSEPDIVIEWVVAGDSTSPCSELGAHHDAQLLALARALGRLAAQRDLARSRADVAERCQSSAEKSATIKKKKALV